jgi:hypothetical protein
LGNSPANTKHQLLHIGTGNLPSGAVVRLGDGTATKLSLSSTGISVAGDVAAQGNLDVSGNLAFGGTLTGIGVPLFLRTMSTVNATTTTEVNIPAFDFVPVVGAVYQIEMFLIASSAATTTGVRVVNSGGAGTLTLAEAGGTLGISAIGGTYAATAAPAANTNFGIELYGVFAASSTAPLQWNLVSEVAASGVLLRAGSILKITRIS